jgi:hypothetical protein
VLLDNDTVKIVVWVGSGVVDEYLGWYEVRCTVENKTDEPLNMYFDYGTTVDGFYEREPETGIFPDGTEIDFLPHETADASLLFMDTLTADRATNLKGILIVYSSDTFETVGEYAVSLDEL